MIDRAGSMSDGFASYIPEIIIYSFQHLEKSQGKLDEMVNHAIRHGHSSQVQDLPFFQTTFETGESRMDKYRVKYAALFADLFAPAAIFTPLDQAAHYEFNEVRFDKWSK